MTRVLLLGAVLAAGCQSQSPYGMVGPATVPAPTTAQSPPYYPPPAIGPPPVAIASTRPSVSADSAVAATPTRQSFAADPSDREPLRIVENATPTRTAAAPGRATAPGAKALQPPASGPGQPKPNASAPPAPQTGSPQSTSSQSSNLPPRLPPAISRLRGFEPAPAENRPGVVPASFQQAAPAFVESPAGAEQWRAR